MHSATIELGRHERSQEEVQGLAGANACTKHMRSHRRWRPVVFSTDDLMNVGASAARRCASG